MTKAKSSVRLHVILSVGEYNALAAESERTGAPMGELIRRALRKAHPGKPSRPVSAPRKNVP